MAVLPEAFTPEGFLCDGCSSAPDSILGVSIHGLCCRHDHRYCTRCWPPGSLTQEWRHAADLELKDGIRQRMPFGLRWVGWLYWRAVYRFGGDEAFDSCGPEAGPACRHGMPEPDWFTHS